MLALMEPSPRASFEPAGAGALLGGVPAAGVGVGGFPLAGWALAAALWAAGEALGFWLSRLPTGADNLGASGLVGIAMAFRGIGVMAALLAVTVADKSLGVSAVIVYAFAYSLSLSVSLLEYFAGDRP